MPGTPDNYLSTPNCATSCRTQTIRCRTSNCFAGRIFTPPVWGLKIQVFITIPLSAQVERLRSRAAKLRATASGRHVWESGGLDCYAFGSQTINSLNAVEVIIYESLVAIALLCVSCRSLRNDQEVTSSLFCKDSPET